MKLVTKKLNIILIVFCSIGIIFSSNLFVVAAANSYSETVNVFLYNASSHPNSSDRLNHFVEGVSRFPNDERFVNGINSSASSLLSWAKSQHEAGNFSTAINRYELILSAPELEQLLRDETEVRLNYAQRRERTPSAESFYESARQTHNSSDKLIILYEGHLLHPNSNKIESYINDSAKSLLNWVKGEHQGGNFDVALERYELILSSPILDDRIRLETKKRLKLAETKKVIPSANTLYNQATKPSNSSDRLALFAQAYALYPSNKDLQTGINESAKSLFDWARKQDYQTAINRYNLILSYPGVNRNLVNEVRNRLRESFFQMALKHSNSSDRIAVFNHALETFPNDSGFTESLNEASKSLLNWAGTQHLKEDYHTAADRYALIMSNSSVSSRIKQEAKYKYDFAKKNRRTPEMYYDYATNLSTSSERIFAFEEGFELYGNSSLITKGMNESALSLFNWATKQQENGEYHTAANRYELIRSSTGVNEKLQSEIIPLYKEALLEIARKQNKPDEKLTTYITGYNLDPKDSRFSNRINSSARSLLTLAINEYNNDHNKATESYRLILSAPTLNNDIKREVEARLKYAEKNESIPTANTLHTQATKQSDSSSRLAAYVEGHVLYPADSRFKDGINDSAQSLLNWASGKHEEGDYETAIIRYNRILNAPVLDNELRTETEFKLMLAMNSKVFSSLDNILSVAKSQPNSSDRLTIYTEGNKLFPNNEEISTGIVDAAKSLLNWASGQHRENRYDVAIDRYQLILSAPQLDNSIKKETEIKLQYALNNTVFPSVTEYRNRANRETSSSKKLEIFTEAYSVYRNNNLIQKGLEDSARSLLEWSKSQHNKGDFTTAIDRYTTLINNPYLSDAIKNQADFYLDSAKSGSTLPTQQITNYNLTLNEMMKIQMGLNPPPQTDRYRSSPVYVRTSDLQFSVSGSITGSGVNVRTAPNTTQNNVAYTLNNGTAFEFIKEVSGTSVSGNTVWYEIRYRNQTLYVHSSLASKSGNVASTVRATNAYESRNTSSHVFYRLSNDTQVTVVDKGNTWTQISGRVWRNAKESDVMTYLNPDTQDLFQHLVLSSSSNVPSGQIDRVLEGKGVLHGQGQAFIDAGREHRVNEIYLISHALLETGHGRSSLADGSIRVGKNSDGNPVVVTSSNQNSLTDIQPVYNMFGIGAADSDPHRLGAIRAYREGWNTPEKAIVGGAKFIGERYIHNRYQQDTLYKMRWNPINPGYPQYATDMGWAAKQVSTIKNMYDMLENPTILFDLPSFK
ncbi:mannosyl-glycoprotein endo-beta-N-acetylglucosaminidase [Natronobacillus azotifigens]|uniref:Glucosaminidase domain-containing protein n=1 Tax=Natronobacillus azotifigens TaxID=472978 RepID=A0A9J6RD83_9BACI|nr:SH3 domain-containing protein [Natronobacillus azotifigens]MCZ0703682.1 glucosaminidase domain-containing protein [Natronobacillus azotifigens]